jgi:hypothetical protein
MDNTIYVLYIYIYNNEILNTWRRYTIYIYIYKTKGHQSRRNTKAENPEEAERSNISH